MKCNDFVGVLSEIPCNLNKKGGSSYMKEHNCSYSTRIGKTTFIVNVKQSETAQKPLNTVFQEICKHEVLEDCSADKSSILENHKNHLTKVNPDGTGYRTKMIFVKEKLLMDRMSDIQLRFFNIG